MKKKIKNQKMNLHEQISKKHTQKLKKFATFYVKLKIRKDSSIGSKNDLLGIDAIIKHYESYVTDDNLPPPFKNDNLVGAFLYYFSLKNLCTL